jgi:hypothetical protein
MMFWKISVATFEALGSRSRRETLMGLCRTGKEEREVNMVAARFGEEPTRVKATSAERSWVTGLARKVAVLELGLRNISVAQAVMVWVPPARPATLKVRGAQKK